MSKVKKNKILIISTINLGFNGITNVILNYYRYMDKSDMKIDLVVPNMVSNDLEKEFNSNGSEIYKISGRNKKPLEYMRKLIILFRKNDYDIVHVHGNSCTLALEMYAAKIGGVKIRIPHSHNSTCKYKYIHKLLRIPFDRNYTHAFACGQKAGEWLYNGKTFEIINNGIDTDRYRYNEKARAKYREQLNVEKNIVVGHIGHFTYQKNHDYLVDIFAELYKLDSNYKLLLLGDGRLRTNIEEKVKCLYLSDVVTFMGNTTEVPQLMQAMDMIIMPSRFEGLPLTLVEAQTACLPCFVSNAVSGEAGITELITYISLERSPKEWAARINNSKLVKRREIEKSIYLEIVDAGYSIVDNAKKLKNLYQLYLKE